MRNPAKALGNAMGKAMGKAMGFARGRQRVLRLLSRSPTCACRSVTRELDVKEGTIFKQVGGLGRGNLLREIKSSGSKC